MRGKRSALEDTASSSDVRHIRRDACVDACSSHSRKQTAVSRPSRPQIILFLHPDSHTLNTYAKHTQYPITPVPPNDMHPMIQYMRLYSLRSFVLI
jgi:hypothetical protein